jgi:hypothetical protein
MRFAARFVTPLMLAGGAAAAVVMAPAATASPLTCVDIGNATQCASPGNSQIVASTPPVQQAPQIIIIHRNRR